MALDVRSFALCRSGGLSTELGRVVADEIAMARRPSLGATTPSRCLASTTTTWGCQAVLALRQRNSTWEKRYPLWLAPPKK